MTGKKPKKQAAQAAPPSPPMPDFDPHQNLMAALAGRPKESGFSIDRRGTHIIDDGIFIRRHNGDGWQIRVSIADIPSIIPRESALTHYARKRLTEHKDGKTVHRLFPVEFLDKYVSLRQGKDRPAITVTMYLDKDFSVVKTKLQRTAFSNMREYWDGAFDQFQGATTQDHAMWRVLMRGLYNKRLRDAASFFDSRFYRDAPPVTEGGVKSPEDMKEGLSLIHEIMRLTNATLTDYCRQNNIALPIRDHLSAVRVSSVSPDFEFDKLCNKILVNGLRDVIMKETPAHFNSPMRDYRDFLSVRILGAHIKDGTVAPDLIDEAKDINRLLKVKAADHCRPLMMDYWRAKWQSIGEAQTVHPLFRVSAQVHYPVVDLRKKFEAAARTGLHVVERTIDTQGLTLTFAAIQVPQKSGMPVQSWAVGYDADETLARAAQRMIRLLPS